MEGLAGTQLAMPRVDVHTHTLYTHSCSGDSPLVEINFTWRFTKRSNKPAQALSAGRHHLAQHYVITRAPMQSMDKRKHFSNTKTRDEKKFLRQKYTISTLNTTKEHRITSAKSLDAL